jgi:cyclic di-GMP phosphodiesterase Gmr
VRAIVAVAQALNLQVIAEGVENAKEDAFLTKNGVNERQGFLFAKPMPAAAFERWLKRYQARNSVNWLYATPPRDGGFAA